jgi:type I restriction enzyme S subunit
MVDTDEPFYYKDGRVLCISVDRTKYNTRFFQIFMREKTIIEYPKLGSGSTFAEFKIFLLKEMDVIAPPLDLQNRFAAFVEQVDKSKFEIQKSLEKLELLKKALMQKYFG